jgi:hypothetical protein
MGHVLSADASFFNFFRLSYIETGKAQCFSCDEQEKGIFL